MIEKTLKSNFDFVDNKTNHYYQANKEKTQKISRE